MIRTSAISIMFAAGLVAACGTSNNTGRSISTGTGGAPVAGVPVALNTSGADSCGAADYKFLQNQPFAHTFDLVLPSNTRMLGRNQKRDATNANRMTLVVSTRSAGMAAFTADAKILKVYCG